MKCKKLLIGLYLLICTGALSLTAMTGYYQNRIDKSYKITKGNSLVINAAIPIRSEYRGKELTVCDEINSVGSSFNVDLKLFGVIPITSTKVEVVDETYVAVLGSPFGIKMYTDGVLIVDITEITTANGTVRPADDAGIIKGDYVLSVDGQPVESNQDLSRIIEDSDGKPLAVKYRRDDKESTAMLRPALSAAENLYRAGLWVKDSTAGIGTLSFYCPFSQKICGLGHGIYDSDTGEIIAFSYGQMVGAEVVSVQKGGHGVTGELKGKLTYQPLGNICENRVDGVYGDATCKVDTTNLTKVCLKQDVQSGNATVICTVDETGPKEYNCSVKVKDSHVNDTTQNLVVTITDEQLIEKTGGIVQGMSGSPIIQNGKLVGIVTHVLIDDATVGYGIFAENMLNTTLAEQVK